MKHCFYLLICMLLINACKKESVPPDPRDAARMEGSWGNLLPTHPDWQYDFNDGILTQSVTDFGVVVTSLKFPYAIRRDTVVVGGDGVNTSRTYVAYLHCDSIAELKNITPGVVLAPKLWLKRTR